MPIPVPDIVALAKYMEKACKEEGQGQAKGRDEGEEEKEEENQFSVLCCFGQAHLSGDQKQTLLHTSACTVPRPRPLSIHSTEGSTGQTHSSSRKNFRLGPGQTRCTALSKLLATCHSKPPSELCPCHGPAGTLCSLLQAPNVTHPRLYIPRPRPRSRPLSLLIRGPPHLLRGFPASTQPHSPFSSSSQRECIKNLSQGIPHLCLRHCNASQWISDSKQNHTYSQWALLAALRSAPTPVLFAHLLCHIGHLAFPPCQVRSCLRTFVYAIPAT